MPGAKFADRYRIVSLVGKGGMGEVYRADDLKLGHTVALKFLPQELSADPQRLEFFHNEVRLSRQVSHPNVCRVYDIGEVDGQYFLSMEYIDGEDLKDLLRRIGRLPQAKGVEIAQQLCSGLAAAHDRGVLHRDLKPANIMIDGRGQVRITDFGLARLADDQTDGEIAGTPAYMAPEQLKRGETTVQSDVYSLGLILYELFTGAAAYEPASLVDMLRVHEESSPAHPSSLVDDLDPIIERVILRCLDKQPSERPRSAQTVAAALPGGDPLAAALAAGETPSPEMVAASGAAAGLKPSFAIAALIGIAVCLLIATWLAEDTHVVNQATLREPAVLAYEAETLVRDDLGYDTSPLHTTHGFDTASGPLHFWYRQRSEIPFAVDSFWNGREFSRGRPTFHLPPWESSNELGLRLDAQGKLRLFRARVPQTAAEKTAGADSSSLPWEEWFSQQRTGLYLARGEGESTDVEPDASATVLTVVPNQVRTPPDAYDAVRVWQGEQIIVQAAAYRGRPVYFEIFKESRFKAEPTVQPENMGERIWYGLKFLVIIGGSVLAWKNIRSGRGDRRGATRLAGFVFLMGAIIWFAQAPHSFLIGVEFRAFTLGIAQALFDAVYLWIFYVAFEPVVRRLCPQILISWTRLLDGRFRDPIVGRDLLLGALTGVFFAILFQTNLLAHQHFLEQAPNMKGEVTPISLAGSKELVASALQANMNGINVGATVTMLLLLFRIVFRSDQRAALTWHTVLIVFLVSSSGSHPVIGLLPIGLIVFTQYVSLMRFGFLAAVVQMIVSSLANSFPLTLDTSHWYFGHGLFAVAWISAIALYGFYISLGGRSLPGTADAKTV